MTFEESYTSKKFVTGTVAGTQTIIYIQLYTITLFVKKQKQKTTTKLKNLPILWKDKLLISVEEFVER